MSVADMALAVLAAGAGFPAKIYSIAATASERLLFSLGVGTLLAVVVWLLLRVFRNKDSRTSFAIWFATLMITAALPVASLYLSSAARAGGRSSGAVVTVSANWAVYIFLAWFSVASIGLARVAVALWQVRKLRREAHALDVAQLGPELRSLAQLNPTLCVKNAQSMGHPAFRWQSRSVELKVSQHLEVPTAIGFFKPAILLPEWLLKETPAEELKYILLHELAHLGRRDDWTNLLQQVVKALLFFLPSIWWIERRLALDREMACDDAVLAQAGTPHVYAECLARVAERSFLRRQLALAQAAVSKLRQLTVRVTRILDPNRQQPARMWKPALPALVVVAGLCMVTASQGPRLVGFSEAQPEAAGDPQLRAAKGSVEHLGRGSLGGAISASAARPAMVSQSSNDGQVKVVPAGLKIVGTEQGSKVRAWDTALDMKSSARHRPHAHRRELYTLTNLHAENKIPRGPSMLAKLQTPQLDYVTVREELVIMVSQNGSATAQTWQLRVVEISVAPRKPQKPVAKKI
jgi:beta-lactamase regulating signal transducer with metallopeptidase domain